MPRRILRKIRNKFKRKNYEDINPEDIFLDSTNLPGFDEYSLEGRIEKPISRGTFTVAKVIIVLIVLALVGKLGMLEIKQGESYARASENNRLEQTLIFANRGVIYDRNMVELATNAVKDSKSDFASRVYSSRQGLAHIVGYLKYPSRDAKGFYYDEEYHGRDGAERTYDSILSGTNGIKLREIDVLGKVTSESVIRPSRDGLPVVLSVDSELTEVMSKAIASLAGSNGFVGGAGVIMDVTNGEIIALTSFPEYGQDVMTSGSDSRVISALLNNPAKPFLNRVIGGLYTPGSIVKPILALAALEENIISPFKEIFSSGSISVPNPYDPEKPTVFLDWRAHGWTAMKEAIAVSSDTYFYSIGGGYGDQVGLGIDRIDKYFKFFGIDEPTGISLLGEVSGIIPTPEWKKENFAGDIWRLGDTYITSIGQYGTQLTPLEAVRFVSAIANNGKLLNPTIVSTKLANYVEKKDVVERVIEISEENWDIVRAGMREAVTYGSSVGLNVAYVDVAGKTGTAELGSAKKYVHSWSVGFFPYNNPHYAFAVVMEKGPSTNTLGATYVMRQVLDWLSFNNLEYFNQ